MALVEHLEVASRLTSTDVYTEMVESCCQWPTVVAMALIRCVWQSIEAIQAWILGDRTEIESLDPHI